MINQAKLITQLDTYTNHLVNHINTLGYVPEFITGNDISTIDKTRLLCQTRSIFFLVDYAAIKHDSQYINLANKLTNVVIKNYFCKDTNYFYQYPVNVLGQNTPNDKMLYELAFVICSFAKLYAVTKDKILLDFIYKTKDYVFANYYSHSEQFAKMFNPSTGVNQNSFMHLFEALLEANTVIKDNALLNDFQVYGQNLINTIYDKQHNLIRENSLVEIFEPGHSFEWASLLLEAKEKNLLNTDIDYSNVVRNAEKIGVNSQNLVYAEVSPSKTPSSEAFRIWPLLEQIRYYAMTKEQLKLEKSLDTLISVFFSDENLPYEYVNDKLEPQQTKVKSTTGYHIINCYKYILG